jgi:hypothetical protein
MNVRRKISPLYVEMPFKILNYEAEGKKKEHFSWPSYFSVDYSIIKYYK